MNKLRLATIYGFFKEEPKKIFIEKDFKFGNSKKYLKKLTEKGLVKELNVIYKTGVDERTIRNIKGYRIK